MRPQSGEGRSRRGRRLVVCQARPSVRVPGPPVPAELGEAGTQSAGPCPRPAGLAGGHVGGRGRGRPPALPARPLPSQRPGVWEHAVLISCPHFPGRATCASLDESRGIIPCRPTGRPACAQGMVWLSGRQAHAAGAHPAGPAARPNAAPASGPVAGDTGLPPAGLTGRV